MIIFCDIDGTLFDNEHRHDLIPADKGNTKAWHEFNARHIYDDAIAYRIQLLNLLAMEHLVIYLTSRTDTFYDTTQSQLRMYHCPPGSLVMRADNDNRPASDFKVDSIANELAARGLSEAMFSLIDDDQFVCTAVSQKFQQARIIKVPSKCCAYLEKLMSL